MARENARSSNQGTLIAECVRYVDTCRVHESQTAQTACDEAHLRRATRSPRAPRAEPTQPRGRLPQSVPAGRRPPQAHGPGRGDPRCRQVPYLRPLRPRVENTCARAIRSRYRTRRAAKGVRADETSGEPRTSTTVPSPRRSHRPPPTPCVVPRSSADVRSVLTPARAATRRRGSLPPSESRTAGCRLNASTRFSRSPSLFMPTSTASPAAEIFSRVRHQRVGASAAPRRAIPASTMR